MLLVRVVLLDRFFRGDRPDLYLTYACHRWVITINPRNNFITDEEKLFTLIIRYRYYTIVLENISF
jgi:hypothetical protein